MTTIQVLGIDGSVQTRQLRANLIEALASLGIKAVVENVSGMDKLMKYHINGIPALVVDGTVVLQKMVPPAEDLKILLNAFVEGAFKQFAMKNIIVPTDFSPAAKGAFQFALDLAELQGGKVKAVHIYHPEFDPESNWLNNSFLDGVSFAKERLDTFVKEELAAAGAGQVATEVEVEQEVITGFAVDEILEQSRCKDIDLMVMGSTGERGFLEKMFGSVSTNVTQRAECPVMLVPQGVQFHGFKHIMYASNYEAAERPTLHKLVDVANTFHANIHFVHVAEEGDSKTYQEVESRLFNVLFNGNEPSFAFSLTKIEGNSVVDGLNDYAIKYNIDLVVMVSPHRNFWEQLFHKSVTKAMTLNTKIPILVLHE
ncbi:MAG: universal stress protein [Saprospiraceae bacterium]|nr:universal stress protein [Saprospiraceae bacterium]MCF8251989.1 universal stress protein [Saprospiraceae bacterium]MCF8281676.1 universal stress protein [Bacteroidales bacterium]MCF8313664.1 universal stress protein [Saprospiraceae bacterium]MCF8442371.1 universal stress protein [Saprospiraceae bacterium]